MEDIARIVVEGEDRSVGIPAISHIPLLHLAAGRIDAELVELGTRFGQQALYGRREEEPVGIRRIYLAQGLELLDIPLLGHLIERQPEGVPCPEERLGDIGGVDEILPRLAPAEVVGRLGIDRILIGSQGHLTELPALFSLCRIIIGQCEPRRDTGHQPSEGFHIDHTAVAVVERGRELRLHVLLQLTLGHILEYGQCHLIGQCAPILPVGRLLLGFLGSLHGQEQRKSHHHGKKSFHGYFFSIYFTYSHAASKKAPTPKLACELASTVCPGMARSPIGCT